MLKNLPKKLRMLNTYPKFYFSKKQIKLPD